MALGRREFLRHSLYATVTGSAVLRNLYMNPWSGHQNYGGLASGIPSPHLTRLVIKPVMTNSYHSDVWEGPCRFHVASPEEEKSRAMNAFESFSKRGRSNAFGFDEANMEMMDPDLLLFPISEVEDFEVTEDQFLRIDQDLTSADVLFIAPGGSSIATYEIARRYNKPVILSGGLSCRTVDISAYCRSKGLEVFVPNSREETNELIGLLRARKVLEQTRILYPTNRGWPSVASVAGINDPADTLKNKFGIDLVTISYDALAEEMDRIRHNKTIQRDARAMADIMYSNAERTFLDKKYVVRSMEFYNTTIQLMKRYECNAFTIECFEFCTSRLPQKWQITPCLIHTMFKDQGTPSACEGDLGGLLSMHLLMSISKKSSHMGNMFFRENGVMEINHSVPGIKMKGYDQPGLPYQLGNFVESGWGTKAVVDFMQSEQKEVTTARMNPTGTGLLVLRGNLVDSKGWDEDLLGCAVSAFIVGQESGAAREFMEKQADYGNHLVWVYGNYAEQLEKIGDLMNIQVDVL